MLPGLGLLPDIRLPTKMRPKPSGCSSGSLERAGREGNLGCKWPPRVAFQAPGPKAPGLGVSQTGASALLPSFIEHLLGARRCTVPRERAQHARGP